MAKQGRYLSADETRKIIDLLASTDMTIGEIAARIDRSPNTVGSVNRRHRVREYAGRNYRWKLHTKKT
jgi:IS30 family transposase